MKTTLKTIPVITLLVLFSTLKTFAQQNNFTGTWLINMSKSDFGKAPSSVAAKQFVLIKKSDSLSIQSTAVGQNGTENTSSSTYSINGNALVKTTPDNRTMTATMKWSAQTQTFTRYGEYSQPGNNQVALKVNETWSISGDGKTLTINKSVENVANPAYSYTIKTIYDKQ